MTKIIVTLLASTLLGGCQSIFGSHAKLEVRPIGAEQTAATAAIALEEGRQHLLRGEVASAIAAFRNAALDPATAAPAHNGLGVAYATLGRGDLAERYFQQAVAGDPSLAKYAANLARLYRSREAQLAKARTVQTPIVVAGIDEAAVPMAESAPAHERIMRAGPSNVVITAATASGAVTRVSRQEIAIRTLPDAPALAVDDQRRRNPRFVAARANPAPKQYPLRVELPKLARH
jgi:tetratricopeptide (TPR) repeat protein